MNYLKLFENFKTIDDLLSDINICADEHGVKIIYADESTIPYPHTGYPVSGYFVDYGDPTLAVAKGKPYKEWVMILVHESSHMDQWIEKSKYWSNNFINGRESVEYIDDWISGKEYSDKDIGDFIKRSIDVELDCEKRTIDKLKKYNIDINIAEETQKANSYILFYNIVKEFRKWNEVGKAPYQIKEVWSKMSKEFDMNYSSVDSDIKNLYLKHCF